MAESSKQSLLRRAAQLFGEEELALKLGVPLHLVRAWISGHATMPDRKLVQLADILEKIASERK